MINVFKNIFFHLFSISLNSYRSIDIEIFEDRKNLCIFVFMIINE